MNDFWISVQACLKTALVIHVIEWECVLFRKSNTYLSHAMRKPDFCLGENKGADQRLCFRYSDSTIPLLLKSEISSF